MKTLLASSTLLSLVFSTVSFAADWTGDYARLLKKYVAPNGVRYSQWKGNADDVAALGKVTDAIAVAPASSSRSKEQLAFYINAYNAWILREALEKYPTRSVKDPLFTFFTAPRITVAGEKMSFNRLEKEIIRGRFNDPRIHFALNCASQSCPPLRAEPYEGSKLDAQLDAPTKAFANSPQGVAVHRKGVAFSKIFDWYKEDFAGAGGVVAFINKNRATPLPSGAPVSFQDYDWGLNEAK